MPTLGLHFGFRVGFDYDHRCCCKLLCNMPSVLQQTQEVWDYMAMDCSEGRTLGPFNPTELPRCTPVSLE